MKNYISISGIALAAFVSIVSVSSAQNFTFSNNLSAGSSGQDVVNLQTWLITNGFDIPSVSSGASGKGYFGSQTQAAVAAYQRSVGLPALGFFGPLTRQHLNSGVGNPLNLAINVVTAPSSLSVNQSGTWSIQATGSSNRTVSYSVRWGDEGGYVMTPLSSMSGSQFSQSTTFTHAYSNSGTYTITFTARDDRGFVATKNVTVTIGTVTTSLILLSPNGGEVWQKGTTQNITWNMPSVYTYVDISLVPYYQPCTGQICPMTASGVQSALYPYHAPYVIANNVSGNRGVYSWQVGSSMYSYGAQQNLATAIPDGQYTLQVCVTGTSNCDSSNAPFTIYTNTSGNRAPVISGIDAPTILAVNQLGTWTVRATDPSNGTLSFSVDYGDTGICPMGYSCTTEAPAARSSTQTVSTFTHQYATPGTYTLRFIVTNSAGLSVQSTATVQVNNTSTVGSLKMTRPNGGEVWQKGTTQTITWTAPAYFRATYADLKLVPIYQCPSGLMCAQVMPAPYAIVTGISINQNSYSWRVGDTINTYATNNLGSALEGQYTVEICESGTSNCDSSDAPFTISSAQTSNVPDVNVVTPNGGEAFRIGNQYQISWRLDGTIQPQYRVLLTLTQNTQPNNPVSGGNYIALVNPSVVGNTFNWTVSPYTITSDISGDLRPGSNYRIRAELYDSYSCYGFCNSQTPNGRMIAYDESDGYITIAQ